MNYLVDILMPVYNHQQFLEQALQSIVSQKTNFNFRLVVGEDCSTDKSRIIIEKFQKNYPNIIVPFFRKKNIGAHQNSKLLFAEMASKYVAICEGDDYWTDPCKLQKQVDFLESNTEFAMCFTNHITINQLGEVIDNKSDFVRQNRNLNHEDILANNYFIGTASVLIKRETLPQPFPTIYFNAPNGDYLLYSLATKFGDVAFLDFYSAAYRIHDNGIWTSRNSAQKYWAMYKTFLISINLFKEKKEQLALKQNLSKILQHLTWAYFELPKSEHLKFIIKSFFISLRFGVLKTWLSINSDLINLFFKNKLRAKTT